jgi:uncharacterized membrane protein YgdD (TMEM256/DUF423 family)
MMWRRLCLVVAGLSGAMAFALAAYSAHGLEGKAADWAGKASLYQLIHAAVLLAFANGRGEGRWLKAASAFFVAGIVLFSGTLYVMALTDLKPTFIVPFGGFSFIFGWLCVAAAALRKEP